MNTQEAAVKTKWGVDASHSEVQFKVKHLVIATVTGFFRKFSGAVETESEDFDGAKVNFSIESNSIDTNVADRDGHLKSPDFFAADQYPTIDFKNGKLKKVSGEEYKLTGDLTIRDITKPVELSVEFNGIVADPWGNTRAGFEVKGAINRKDYNLSWSAVTEAGKIVVGDDVKLLFNIEVVKG
ncbi:MAG TPA: YceI family protein [Cyclobacteriaceae bacterium]|nr:YceI family protein [Cyclobacteriaceae bacterium]